MMKRIIRYLLIPCIALAGCKKMVTADFPPNQLTYEKVFTDSTSVSAASANLFTLLGTVDANLVRNLGLYTDELKTTTVSASLTEFSSGSLTTLNSNILSVWQNLYSTIYKANSIIEGLEKSSGLPSSVKSQALGQSKFVRGYCYLLLTELYGDVPLVLTTNVQENASAARSPLSVVLVQVVNDLSDASSLLPTAYPLNGEKTEANSYAAMAFLAKADLNTSKYQSAEASASAIINSGNYRLLADLNSIFTQNNDEAILQLWNPNGSSTLNSVVTAGVPPNQVSSQLLASFEANDLRRISWIGSTKVSGTSYYFPYKYKQKSPVTGPAAEYTTYMRLAEVYLIRAEARANLDKIPEGLTDLNIVRTRAGLPNLTITSKPNLLSAILRERRIELLNENGSRLFDLNRYGLTDATLQPLKPLWKSGSKLFPIPQSEILTDPQLTQNNGY
jgi:hypothetical protein